MAESEAPDPKQLQQEALRLNREIHQCLVRWKSEGVVDMVHLIFLITEQSQVSAQANLAVQQGLNIRVSALESRFIEHAEAVKILRKGINQQRTILIGLLILQCTLILLKLR